MLTGVSGPTGATRAARAGSGRGQRSRRAWRDRRGWRWAAVAAGILVLFYCAQREARQMGVQSDGAGMVLESWAMLHGNLLLHGWHLSDVSFYTTELPEYMLVELFRGLNPDVVRICAALTYTLIVVLAAAVAYGARPADKRTAMVRAGIAVAIMVGPTVAAASVLLNDPDHTGTAVPILLALLILDRARRRWWVPVLIAAVLGWALVGDSLVLLIGVAPLVVVGGARSFGLVALGRAPLSAAWYDLALAAVGLAAAVGGTALSALIKSSGGFELSPQATQYAVQSAAAPANAAATVSNFLGLFSADFFGARLNPWLAVTAVHLAFARLVAGGLFVALRASRRNFLHGDLIAQLLAAALVINLLGYLLLYPAAKRHRAGDRPGLRARRGAGRPGARRAAAPAPPGAAARPRGGRRRRGAAAAAADPVTPTAPAASGLARFLAAHQLRSGLAGYWDADSTTLDSAGRVVVRTIRFRPGHGLVAYPWEIDTRLYDGAANDANFLVATGPGARSSVTEPEAVAAFGQPYRRYLYHGYTIMVWHKNLLAQLPRS